MLLRFIRGNILAILAGLFLIGPFLFSYHILSVLIVAPFKIIFGQPPDPYFHFVVPVTTKEPNLCKLLLGSRILGFPDPVLVGWGGDGPENPLTSHIFKVQSILDYLKGLDSKADKDLVLIVDAYDVWLQLRPEVVIRRYQSVIERANDRLKKEQIFGKIHAGAEVRQSIVFGADTGCFPQKSDAPACWATPDSTFPRYVYGPGTDNGDGERTRARWLNSGTIMGPVADLRDMFSATLDMVHEDRGHVQWEDVQSDQYYFNEVFGDQELNRNRLRDPGFDEGHPYLEPTPEMQRTEYGITLDYEFEIFQIAAGNKNHITWMRLNNTTPKTRTHGDGRMPRLDDYHIPDDMLGSDHPFAGSNGTDGLPFLSRWQDLPLGVNAITGLPFPVLHMTSEKWLREDWWMRLWYQGGPEYSAHVLAAGDNRVASRQEHVFAIIDDLHWRPAALRTDEYDDEKTGGAWTIEKEFIPYDDICEEYYDLLHKKHDKGAFSVGYPAYGAISHEDDSIGRPADSAEDKGKNGELPEGAADFAGEELSFGEGVDIAKEAAPISDLFNDLPHEAPAEERRR